MDGRRMGIVLYLASALVAGCGRPVDPARLPRASETIVEVGKRLGATLSPSDLERLADDPERLLRQLTASERLSLGRGYLRFRVDRPVIVGVAVPDRPAAFWLADAGFRRVGTTVPHPDGPFDLWTRRFEAGTVGLGVNALDRRARGHYAVFVRGVDGTASIEAMNPDGWRDVPVVAGVGPYSDDASPFAAIPPDLAQARLLQPRRDSRDATALVRGKVWKTRVPSSSRPDQVVVSFGDDPAHSLAWTWRTDPSVSASVVKLEGPDGRSVRRVGGIRPITSEGLLNDPKVHRHVVEAGGLEPDTVYRYAVGDGSESGWGPWFSVRTAPEGDRDYTFLAMGDPQCGLEDWGKLLHAARSRNADAGFLLIAGDLVDRGNERGNWDHFFLRAAGVFEVLPLMPCVGNHEYLDRGPMIFAGSFRLPNNGPNDVPHGLTYAFEYSDAFVAVLDSNPAVYSAPMARRLAGWLDERLARTKARWKFVVFHHPIYPSHPSREQPQLAEAWVPVLDRHKVDLVLQGHDHAYLRTYPMQGGRVVGPTDGGTVYVVSVSGQKFVPLADRDYTARGFADVATYQTIDISPRRGTLLYRALDIEGRELDRLELSKPLRTSIAERPPVDRELRRSTAP